MMDKSYEDVKVENEYKEEGDTNIFDVPAFSAEIGPEGSNSTPWVIASWARVNIDNYNSFSGSNGYVAPEDGIYYFEVSVEQENYYTNASEFVLSFLQNGSSGQRARSTHNVSSERTALHSEVIQLNEGDLVEVQLESSSGQAAIERLYSRFRGWMVI